VPTRSPDEHQLEHRRLVGERIRFLRRQAGLSQERLGEAVGVDRRTIGSWENAVTPPTLDDITALARSLNVAPWRLFYG
jgi:transcriptional regulator with XRE-family HTH domain